MERLSSNSPWELKLGYSRAVIAKGLIFVSATAATGADGKVIGRGDIYEQTRTVLQKLADVLNQAGSRMEDVLQTRLYVTDIAKWQEAGRAHGEVFGAIRPAMTILHVKSFVDPEMLIEIELTALKSSLTEPSLSSSHRKSPEKATMAKKEGGFDPLTLSESNATNYPEPYRAANRLRWNRRLGDHAGLTNFGVNLTRIAPGGQSSSRHWHTQQDEFLYVLSGEAILQTEAGEQTLRAGMCAGFAAGQRNGHQVINRSTEDVELLVIGDRMAGDEVGYPDIDMHRHSTPDGGYRFTRKDGSPLD